MTDDDSIQDFTQRMITFEESLRQIDSGERPTLPPELAFVHPLRAILDVSDHDIFPFEEPTDGA